MKLLHPYYLTFGNLCLMCCPTLNLNSKLSEYNAPPISFGSLANIQYGVQNLIVNIDEMFFLIHCINAQQPCGITKSLNFPLIDISLCNVICNIDHQDIYFLSLELTPCLQL
jgi:hypothetical protein